MGDKTNTRELQCRFQSINYGFRDLQDLNKVSSQEIDW
jgi:hypothetical protein